MVKMVNFAYILLHDRKNFPIQDTTALSYAKAQRAQSHCSSEVLVPPFASPTSFPRAPLAMTVRGREDLTHSTSAHRLHLLSTCTLAEAGPGRRSDAESIPAS